MKTYWSATIAFVPSATRADRLNIGVLVVDPAERRHRIVRLRGLRSKVRAVSAAVEPIAVEDALAGLELEVGAARPGLFSTEPSDELTVIRRISATWVNQIQVDEPGEFRAASFDSAVRQLGALHLGDVRKSRETRTRQAVRQRIRSTINQWDLGPYRLDEARIRTGPDRVAHQADFWLVNGRVDAALYAFAPDSELNAIVLRDSMPTVLEAFRKENSDFEVVAVTTPDPASTFQDAAGYLRQHGVQVTTTDELDSLRSSLLKAALL